MSLSENVVINDFLLQVKRKLPEWLKWKVEETNKILKELEEQILNEARTIAQGQEPSDADLRQTIMHLGSPESIAKLYKLRGTPKFYITEELFEFYLRSLFFFFGIIIFINIIIAAFKFFFNPWWEVLGEMFGGIWIGCLIAAVVVTVAFVYFSVEGFLPEDFGIIPKRLALIFPFNLTEEELVETREITRKRIEEARIMREQRIVESKEKIKDSMVEAKLIREKKLAEAKVLRKQKLSEAKIERKRKLEEARQKRALKKKYPVSLGDLIFGAVAGIIFGLFLIIQPFAGITGLFDVAFLNWVRLFGLLIFISGLFSLVRLAVGVNSYTGQQVMIVLQTIYNLTYIPLFLTLLYQPQIFPIELFTGGVVPVINLDPSSLPYIIYFWVLIIIVIGIIGGMIGNFYKVYKIQKFKQEY